MQQSRQAKRANSLTLVNSWQSVTKWPCYLSVSESHSTDIYECLCCWARYEGYSPRPTGLWQDSLVLSTFAYIFLIFSKDCTSFPGAVPQYPPLVNLLPPVICPEFPLFHSGKYLSFQVLVAILNIQPISPWIYTFLVYTTNSAPDVCMF